MLDTADLFLDEELVHDRTPLRHSDDGGCERGCARAHGRGCGIVGRRERPQDPLILWSRNYIPRADRPFGEPSPGPSQRYPNDCREGTFFCATFTDDISNLIAPETNRYHDQQASAEPHKHTVKWTPVRREEIEASVGIMIYMGIVKLPRIKMYWSNDTFLHQETVRSVMSQTRFLQIGRYFHLPNNSKAVPRGSPGFDKISRGR